ncbi:MAG TPA: aminotransferase class I/II-fold pyridoxal phosphate-dependent enzyme, partial [Longimicrobium sp.]|nr:aminotransferase class I/II-fold pyridoxal phosphate-dependent enzyme [Longimicrobium sp.]
MKTRPDLDALIRRHRQLDNLMVGTNRKRFLSDWNCDNPLLDQVLGPELASLSHDGLSRESYIYFDTEESLLNSICSFHHQFEALSLSHSNVVAGPGSSSFLAAFAIWLRRSGYTEAYYIPPLYHTFYFLLESLDINLTPVSTLHAYEAEFSMNLPPRNTVLLMCDPVWYAGKAIPAAQVAAIADWQRATKSLVFVDGSFQYMKWSYARNEATAMLDPELTFRLVCPAKTLAVPFYRFAYLLHPSSTHPDLVFLYESMVGGASASDLAFAHRALKVLTGDGNLERVMPESFKR